MPELPEVETTRRGLESLVLRRQVKAVQVRERRLRWPVPNHLAKTLQGRKLLRIERRAKYLLFGFTHGTLIGHLGMSGSMRVCAARDPLRKHDHVRIRFSEQRELRYHDPRRFGFLLWTGQPPELHPRLRELGPEPLGSDFDGAWLAQRAKGRTIAVKPFIMDAKVVVGVGNIYASEALFRCGIRPNRSVSKISRERWARLAAEIQAVLQEAIAEGGTTLRDFLGSQDEPGYFAQDLRVYDREGDDCVHCGSLIKRVVLGQRSTFYCAKCQT